MVNTWSAHASYVAALCCWNEFLFSGSWDFNINQWNVSNVKTQQTKPVRTAMKESLTSGKQTFGHTGNVSAYVFLFFIYSFACVSFGYLVI
jgi:hypothetical protein